MKGVFGNVKPLKDKNLENDKNLEIIITKHFTKKCRIQKWVVPNGEILSTSASQFFP